MKESTKNKAAIAVAGIILAFAILFVGAMLMPARASTPASLCTRASELAATVMEARQMGLPASEFYRGAEQPVVRAIILAAYKVPRYETREYQQNAIADYRNEVFIDCLENL